MSLITKPMLSAKFEDFETESANLKFPLYGTAKYDGIRALMIDGSLLSRTFKEIPNRHIFETCSVNLPNGLDGELVSGSFNETTGNVMRHDGVPLFEYHVFDYVKDSLAKPYLDRMKDLKNLKLPDWCIKVLPTKINNLEELEILERDYLRRGFEGIMLRSGDGKYKCGRGTVKAMDLVKVKRFKDGEAEIIGVEEEMKNENFADKDAFGRTKRSTSQENLVGKDTLGALVVRALNGEFKGIEFKLGTGYTKELRQELWTKRKKLIGKIVKYKYQSEGSTDAPRFPVYLGERSKEDM